MVTVKEKPQRVQIDSIGSELFDVKHDALLIETAASVGYEQMQRFLQEKYISEPPHVWVGGRDGGIQKLGRTRSVHAFDLAQTYGVIRNRLVQAVPTGQTIEVHKPQEGNHLPLHGYIQPDLFDLVAMEATLQGALAACDGNPHGREVSRARPHMQRLLSGDTFQKERVGDYLHSTAKNRPQEDDVIGAVIILWTVIDRQPRILVQEETMPKPHFDKNAGDMSLLAEGRRPFEPIGDLLRRTVREEIGWGTNTMILNKHPIGYYHFSDHDRLPGGGWIAAVEAQVDPIVVLTTPVGSQDGETRNHMWVPPDVFFEKFPARGAMLGIVGDWMRGDRDKVSPATPGRHDTQVIFEQGNNGNSGSVIIQSRNI